MTATTRTSGARGAGPRAGPFRAHARRAVRLRALLTHVQEGWQRQVQVENVSLGGACIVAEQRMTPGETVTLSFTAPSLWDPLVLRARIAWVSSDADDANVKRAGLSFDHKSADAVFALYELIATLAYE